jgi:hypothetical protein
VPQAGRVRPTDEPGFGLGLTLADIDGLSPGR